MVKTYAEVNPNLVVPIILNQAVENHLTTNMNNVMAQNNNDNNGGSLSLEKVEGGCGNDQHEEMGFENDGTPSKSLEIASGDATTTEESNNSSKSSSYPTQSPRFGGLSDLVETSIRSLQSASTAIINAFVKVGVDPSAPFAVTAKDLSDLSSERTHKSLARLLDKAATNLPPCIPGEEESLKNARLQIEALVKRIGTEEDEHDIDATQKSGSSSSPPKDGKQRDPKSEAHKHDMESQSTTHYTPNYSGP